MNLDARTRITKLLLSPVWRDASDGEIAAAASAPLGLVRSERATLAKHMLGEDVAIRVAGIAEQIGWSGTLTQLLVASLDLVRGAVEHDADEAKKLLTQWQLERTINDEIKP